MSKNRLYTLSYFIKRLADNKIFSEILINNNDKRDKYYSKDDIRQWTILIDPNNRNIICTCFKKTPKNFWFKLNTKYNDNIKIKTLSMQTIINIINDLYTGPDNVLLSNDRKISKRTEK